MVIVLMTEPYHMRIACQARIPCRTLELALIYFLGIHLGFLAVTSENAFWKPLADISS